MNCGRQHHFFDSQKPIDLVCPMVHNAICTNILAQFRRFQLHVHFLMYMVSQGGINIVVKIYDNNINNQKHSGKKDKFTVYIDNYPRLTRKAYGLRLLISVGGPLATSSKYTKLLVDFLLRIFTNIYIYNCSKHILSHSL